MRISDWSSDVGSSDLSFSAFIVGSPSLWWNGFAILEELPAFRDRLAALSRQPRVFVDVGAREQELPTSVPEGIGVTLAEAQAQIRASRMVDAARERSEEHTSELQSLMRISYAVFCLSKTKHTTNSTQCT